MVQKVDLCNFIKKKNLKKHRLKSKRYFLTPNMYNYYFNFQCTKREQ